MAFRQDFMHSRPLALILLLGSAILGSAALAADEKLEVPDPGACRALYLSRIEKLSQDSSDVAAPGIELRRKELESEEAVQAAVKRCEASMTREQVRCALDPAKCGQSDVPVEPDLPEQAAVPATAQECTAVYEHLLSVFATEELKKRPGGEQLLENWKSAESRKSFQARCLKAFHKDDAQCILSSKDPDIARACLLVIPE